MICPFCNIETTPENYGSGMRKYTSHRCMNTSCTINELPRWMVCKTYDEQYVMSYRAVIPYKERFYIVEGCSPHWTRLYYNDADMGALSQAPIVEISKMLPLTEPYSKCIKKIFGKLIVLLPFI